MNFLDDRLPMRFWDKVQPCPMTGCWLWTGSDAHGYGRFTVGASQQPAHRIALSVIETIDLALEIDHKCVVRACVNPAHLHQVSRERNCALTRIRNVTCRRGHKWNESNTRWRRNGKYDIRVCKECYREWTRERHTSGAP